MSSPPLPTPASPERNQRFLQALREQAVLRQWSGPLTRQLERERGGHGLGQLPRDRAPDGLAAAVCGFCSTGCGLLAHMKDGRALGLSPDPRYPVNRGMACPKGWEALTPLDAPNRAVVPLLRHRRGEPLRPASWPEAAAFFVERMRAVQDRHGKEAAAFLSTGQIMCEEMALLGAFAKFGMGMKHGDGNTRQCMATAVTAYKESFGFDAPPFTYRDFEESDVLVFVGANPCIAHPILWQRVLNNRHDPAIIVIDPRNTETAMAATHHLPLKPKSDLILLYGLAHELIRIGAVDETFVAEHTGRFDEFKSFARDYPLEKAAWESGLRLEDLQEVARLIAAGKRVSFWWTMGVNQGHEATRTAQAIINLALMTGNIGRPGTGANSITGQCNAMGSRLFSNTSSLIGGHAFENPDHRRRVAEVLEIPEERIQTEPGWPYHRILEGAETGEIHALWILATNPAHSWIDQDRGRQALQSTEFLVVQDMYADTETARMADLVLPAAGWGEKEGTFINSERRIGVSVPVRQAPGEALSDFRIIRLLADAWGCGELFAKWTSPEAVFRLLRELTRGRPCDITGIDGYAMLTEAGGIQWPLPEGAASHAAPERRLFEDGKFFTDDGRARFHFEAPRPAPESPDAAYPLCLLTGRGTSAQWHTQTRTANSAILRKLYPQEVYLEIHPEDAARAGIRDRTLVRVTSRRGSVTATAAVLPTVRPGQVFMPMHYPECNRLTHARFDPYSHQPSYKAGAVRIEPAKTR